MKPSEALTRLQTMCAGAEMCSSEALKKLDRWEIPEQKQRLILALLRRGKFIDDSRFAHTYARDKMIYSNWGRFKIRRGLYSKEIPKPLIDNALESLDAEEYEQAAMRTVQSKVAQIGTTAAATRVGREKVLRLAVSRGFELSLASRLLSTLLQSRSDN